MRDDTYDYNCLIPDIGYFVYRNNTPDWKIDESVIDFVDITYVVGGRAVYMINNEEICVSAGDLLCIPKGSLRSAVGLPGDLLECFSTNFQLRNFSGNETDMPLPLIFKLGYNDNIITLYKELNGEWLRREPGYVMKSCAYFMLILQHYFELMIYKTNSAMFDTRIKKAVRYMTDHYAEPLSIGRVADIVDLNPVYFGALFKQATGETFRQYLTTIRLNHAENMLRNGKSNVNETSRDCGFTDIFYFSRLYKKFKGVPPSVVHKMATEEYALRRQAVSESV